MIALHGAYYNNNFGDLLLVKIFESWIRDAGGDEIVFPMVSQDEKPSFEREFPNALYGLQQNASWKAMVYAGGGYFGEPDSNRGKLFLGAWNRRFLQTHVAPGELCIQKKIPYAIVAIEAGPLSGLWVRHKAKRICNSAVSVSARNADSTNYLRESLRVTSDVQLIPDAALTIGRSDIPEESRASIEKLFKPFGSAIRLGIHHPSAFVGNSAKRVQMREGLLECLKKHRDVLPVVFDDSGETLSESASKLAGMVKSEIKRECLVLPFRGIWNTLALIDGLSAVLTNKLHVGIVAYALGIHCESFAAHQKTPRFYALIGRPEQCTVARDANRAITVAKIEQAIERGRINKRINDQTWRGVKEDAGKGRTVVENLVANA